MRLQRTTLTALLLAALAVMLTSPAAAGGVKPICQKVFSVVDTVWIEDGLEVGDVSGLLNGGVYLRYGDKEPPIDPMGSKPNMVITSKTGTLYLWVAGVSSEEPDGTVTRSLTTLRATGTGEFAYATIDLDIFGACYPGKGGYYEVSGTICRAPRVTGRRR